MTRFLTPWTLLAAAVLTPAYAQLTVTLSTSLASPQPVGTPVTWTAGVATPGATPVYRFDMQVAGGTWSLLRDYDAPDSIDWTTIAQGALQVRVTALDTSTGMTGQAVVLFAFTSRVASRGPVVSPAANPLVALYSAPPCSSGTVRVLFRPASGGAWQSTPSQNCTPNVSLNFYVAGMRANLAYTLVQQISSGTTVIYGPLLSFQTGTPPFTMPALRLTQRPDATAGASQRMLLTSFFALAGIEPQYGAIATDLLGNLMWYYAGLSTPSQIGSYLVRPTGAGAMLTILGEGATHGQIFREIDLAGNLVRETSVTALNQQLAVMGRDPIDWMSHEALRLPNGHTLVLSSVERILTDVQGPGPVDVLGDMILDLDQDFQIAWTWNAFDFLDTSRMAILGETCSSGSCGVPLRLAAVANDWTHGNSLTYLADGNIALSMRNQDMVVKIDYAGGTGNVLWRLGSGGDFSIVSADPWPWFSHQHDFEFDGTNFELFDNGDTRVHATGGQSRGQVLSLDENAMVATLLLNQQLGSYSNSWGSAQLLATGDYHFMSGGFATVIASASLEYQPDGTAAYGIMWASTAYRSFRMNDLYTAPH